MAKRRLYSLFCKQEGRWIRLSTSAMFLDAARRVHQSGLLAGSLRGLHMGLRPVAGHVEPNSPEAIAIRARVAQLFKG